MGDGWRPFVLGGIACCTAELVTFPIDTTKTRLQVQGQHTSAFLRELHYRNMFHALYRIPQEEGFARLYRGLPAALLRQSIYGTLKLGMYHSLKRRVYSDSKKESMAANTVMAVVSGGVSAAVATPTDRIKLRMQAQSPTVRYTSLLNAFTTIVKTEGFAGLYKGIGPTSQRAALVAGVELPVYEFVKHTLTDKYGFSDTAGTHFLSSSVSGFCSASASTPIDVVKSRYMNQAIGEKEALYRGSLDCLIRTVRTEGVRALYKGFVPTFVRQSPWNIACFMTFEQLKRIVP